MGTLVRARPDGAFAGALREACAERGMEIPTIEEEPAGGPGVTVLVDGRPAEEVLDACPDLRWVLVPFAGIPAATTERLRARPHLRLANLHHNAAPTAETALALLLAAAKRIVPADAALRRGDWSMRYADDPSPILAGRRALVLGLGAIGTRVARALQALEVSVRGVVRDPSSIGPRRPDGIPVVPIERLEEELPGADILVVTIPATDATRGLLDRARLDLLPEGAVLVNVGRAAVIDEAALHHSLVHGPLGAAGIDVWWQYPEDEAGRTATAPSALPYADLPNVVLSPHRAGHGSGIETLRATHCLDRLAEIAAGTAVPLDLDRGY